MKGNEDSWYEIGIDTCILFLLRGLLGNDHSLSQGLLYVIKMAVRRNFESEGKISSPRCYYLYINKRRCKCMMGKVRRKMTAFTTIPCKPITADRLVPVPTRLCMLGLKILELVFAFLCAFIVFSHAKKYG